MKSYEEILTKIPLFEGISQENLLTMLQCLKVQRKSYRKGEMIFREGDSADMVGVVLNGCVQIVRDDYYGNYLQFSRPFLSVEMDNRYRLIHHFDYP